MGNVCQGCMLTGNEPGALRAPDVVLYHAYTDGTDTIIGTSLQEAIEAYSRENPDAEAWGDTAGMWEQLGDEQRKTMRTEDGDGERITKPIREWIDLHIAESPTNFSRLLCSTEY